MPNYDKIIEQSHININALFEKLKDLENLHQEIKVLREAASDIPKLFNKKFEEAIQLSNDYTNTLGVTTKTYLDGNNILFVSKLNELSAKIKELEQEVIRLVNTDFNSLFKDLQKVFIDQSREDLATELQRFEAASKNFQTRIAELKQEISRLEQIDLDKQFDKLQKTLGEIFGAINAINLALTNSIQTLTGIVQSLGTIQTIIDANYKHTKQLLKSFEEDVKKHLSEHDKYSLKLIDLLETKTNALSQQNGLLRKAIKTNRLIQVVGFTILLIVLIYVAVKKQ